MIDTNELREKITIKGLDVVADTDILVVLDRLEAAEKERDALRSKNHQYQVRLRKILEEPENTMSNSKALAEVIRQARIALGVKK